MMDTQLTIASMIKRTEQYFPKKEVISRTQNGVQTFTYKDIISRMKRLGSALESLGVKKRRPCGNTCMEPSPAFRGIFCCTKYGGGSSHY